MNNPYEDAVSTWPTRRFIVGDLAYYLDELAVVRGVLILKRSDKYELEYFLYLGDRAVSGVTGRELSTPKEHWERAYDAAVRARDLAAENVDRVSAAMAEFGITHGPEDL